MEEAVAKTKAKRCGLKPGGIKDGVDAMVANLPPHHVSARAIEIRAETCEPSCPQVSVIHPTSKSR